MSIASLQQIYRERRARKAAPFTFDELSQTLNNLGLASSRPSINKMVKSGTIKHDTYSHRYEIQKV